MKKMIIRVGGMSCQHCAKAIERALLGVAGVISVQVELANARAMIDYDESLFILQKAEQAIIDQGYEFLGIS